MSPLRVFHRILKRAPANTGAVCFGAIALLASGCDKRGGTPDWDTPGKAAPTTLEAAAPGTTLPKQTAGTAVLHAAPIPSDAPAPGNGGFRFIAYNVENWLTMDRYVDRKNVKQSPKPDSEKSAVIKLLAKHHPDVLGLCEIGTAADLAEIQQSLKSAGLDLPHLHYTGGSDPTRHLGLLSRFPIASTARPKETDYQMKGQTFAINRGILDATIKAHGKPYRFLGVHLKSKREIEGADQEDMRVHEARLLRRHVDSILQTDTEARLVVYGDFNDTRPSKSFKSVTGSFNDPGYLTAIPFKDSRGHAWTYFWALHEIYSRIDFVTVTKALRPEVDFRASSIIDDPNWNAASDHRPLLAIFK